MRILFKSTFQFNLVMPDKILIDKMSPAPYFTLLGGRGEGRGRAWQHDCSYDALYMVWTNLETLPYYRLG